jgi:formylglycine-generating enzyme required for sulfatase activity
MPETKKLQVFLCHASLDKPQVRELYKYLRRRGIAPWLDAENLLPGQDWQVEIPQALLASDAIIVCLSKNSVNKEGYVQKEITFALDKAQEKLAGAIFIIPAKLEECDVPARLNRYQWVDLHQPGGYQRLMRGLKRRAEQLQRTYVDESQPVSTPAPDRPTAEMLKNDEAEKRAVEQAEAEKLAAQQAEQERLAREKAEAERIAREKAEAERIAQEKIEQERLAHEKAEAERIAAEEAEKQRLAILKAENERIARLKAEQERIARQKAEAERIAKQKFTSGLFGYLQSKWETVKWEAGRKAERDRRARGAHTETWADVKTPVLIFGGLLLVGMIGLALLYVARPPFLTMSVPTSTPEVFAMQTPQATETLPPATFTPAPPTYVPFTLTPTPSFRPPHVAGAVMVSPKDGMKLHYVPAGNFLMGDNNQTTYVDAFWIDETEVTNRMYALCVAAGTCQPPSNKSSATRVSYYDNTQYTDYPVIYVSWNDAKAYCAWAGRALPSEAQWEKAARGPDGSTYPWGNAAPNKDLLNYNSNIGDTTKVGFYKDVKSFYRTFDMAGNVSEWANDWYDSSQQHRVLRGGSWTYNTVNLVHSADRIGFVGPDYGLNYIGFRCALSQ